MVYWEEGKNISKGEGGNLSDRYIFISISLVRYISCVLHFSDLVHFFPTRWVDRMLIRLCQKFGEYNKVRSLFYSSIFYVDYFVNIFFVVKLPIRL